MTTPPARVELADGSAWVLSPLWRVATGEERRTMRCRRKLTGRTTCGRRPAVVTIRTHGSGTARWPYCTDHAAEFDQYVIDGVVRHRERDES